MRGQQRIALLRTLKELDNLLARHQVRYDIVIHGLHLKLAASPSVDIPPDLAMQARELFGGMGSLNDLYISRANGHLVDDERAANQELCRLREAFWEMVSDE